MKLKLLYIYLFLNYLSFSQEVKVKGVVYNLDNDPIKEVKITYGKKIEDYTYTNIKGEYSFSFDISQIDSIKFSHVGYEQKFILIDKTTKRNIKNNILILNVNLNYIELKEIEVGAQEPEVLFGTQEYSVEDFEIDGKGNMVLLTYDKTLKKGAKLRLLDKNQKVIDTYILQEEAIEIKTDYRKNIHLITTYNVFLVWIENNMIQLFREDKDYYFKYIVPIIDTLDEKIYYSNFSEIYPAFDYFQFDTKDSVYTKLIEIIDEPLMEQYRAEYKFSDVRTKLWAHNKEFETGIDKEIWVGAAIFSQSIYYTPLYAPMFVKNDTVIILNHYSNLLYRYVPSIDEIVDSVLINYHFNPRKTGWEQPIIQDKEQEKIYLMFKKAGFTYLSELNTVTGKIVITRKLYYKYIEKIKIMDGYAYYIYRPYESIQKKYIYKEKI